MKVVVIDIIDVVTTVVPTSAVAVRVAVVFKSEK